MKLANLRKRGLERDRGGRRKGGEKGVGGGKKEESMIDY
jgi:hypothetical protein